MPACNRPTTRPSETAPNRRDNDLATHDVATVDAGAGDDMHIGVRVGLQYDDGRYWVTIGRTSSPEPVDLDPHQALVLAETVKQAALRALGG